MRYFFNHSLTEHAHDFDLLKAADASVHIAVSNNNPNNPIRYSADEFVIDPASAEGHPMAGDYSTCLLDAAKAARADIVIPYRHRMELSGLLNLFTQNGIRPLTAADLPTMPFVENKPKFLYWAQTLGIPGSPILEFSSLEEF